MYNRSIHSETKKSPFKVVYGKNYLMPLDLAPLPNNVPEDIDGPARDDLFKEMHERTRAQLERRTAQYVRQANKDRKELIF